MDAETRFVLALAKQANERMHAEGLTYTARGAIDAIAATAGVDDPTRRHVLARLQDEGLLVTDNGHSYKASVGFALYYEEDADRAAFWMRNQTRRELLRIAASAFERGDRGVRYDETRDRSIDLPYGEAVAAARVLESLGLIDLQLYAGHSFAIAITSAGYDVTRSEDALKQHLPTNATEDEEAHAAIARDTLGNVISDLDELLEAREWHGARREFARGDKQYDDGHWADAVGEYYSAIESGLKHRLEEAGVNYGASSALRQLAREAAKASLFPRNYQDLFSYIDSIRSPRRHGAGGRADEVEIGPAEALLMANLARSLVLYLGHRPQ